MCKKMYPINEKRNFPIIFSHHVILILAFDITSFIAAVFPPSPVTVKGKPVITFPARRRWKAISLRIFSCDKHINKRSARSAPATEVAVTSLAFFLFPPVIPLWGISRPPPHQAEAGAAPGHSSAPALSRPLHSPFRAQARASPALSSAPGTGTALADPRAVFSFQAASQQLSCSLLAAPSFH